MRPGTQTAPFLRRFCTKTAGGAVPACYIDSASSFFWMMNFAPCSWPVDFNFLLSQFLLCGSSFQHFNFNISSFQKMVPAFNFQLSTHLWLLALGSLRIDFNISAFQFFGLFS